MLAPPNLSVGVISETFRIAVFCDGGFSLRFDFCRNRKLCNRATFLQFFIKPSIVKTRKNPLRPLVILRIGCIDFFVPIVRKSETFNLATEIIAILFRRNRRMRSGLNRVLFCRKSECIPTHRVQNIKTFRAFVTADDIGCGITFGVTDVQSCARRIREHVQAIILRLRHIGARFKCFLGFPSCLPFGLDFLRIILCHL